VRKLLLSGAAAATLLALSVPASANGRFPASNQMVFSSTDKNLIVLRTSYGILPSHDNGASWGYICEDALGLGTMAVEDPSIGLTTTDSLLVGVSRGLNVSTDVGCNWDCITANGLGGQGIADLAVRPDNQASAVAITKTYILTDGAQGQVNSQVYETTDNGVTWTAIGTPIDPNVLVQTIDVAKGDPNRLYVSGTRGYGDEKNASLFVSTDKGMTWKEQVFPAALYDPTTEDSVYIAAVDPSNIERVYLRSSGIVTGGRSRLTVVDSASTTPKFSTAQIFEVEGGMQGETTGELLGFALSPDGSKVYIGTKEDGLWMASSSDLNFTKKSSIVVQCLATRGDELWACSAAVSGFIAGVSTDDGAHFASKLPLIGALSGPIACTPNAAGAACTSAQNSSQCGDAYKNFCTIYGCGVPEGGTTPEGGATSDGGKGGGGSSSSSSCAVSFVGVCKCWGGPALAGSLAVFGVAMRRRRKRK
jgi:photosystem II stability/assembly factor-like uncharacterized protein